MVARIAAGAPKARPSEAFQLHAQLSGDNLRAVPLFPVQVVEVISKFGRDSQCILDDFASDLLAPSSALSPEVVVVVLHSESGRSRQRYAEVT